jgi:hypothetical protein
MRFAGLCFVSVAFFALTFVLGGHVGTAGAQETKSRVSKLTKANAEKIKNGMTAKEVEDILGAGKDMPASEYPQPRTRAQARIKQILDAGGTALKWEEGRRMIIVVFKEKKVTATSTRNLP